MHIFIRNGIHIPTPEKQRWERCPERFKIAAGVPSHRVISEMVQIGTITDPAHHHVEEFIDRLQDSLTQMCDMKIARAPVNAADDSLEWQTAALTSGIGKFAAIHTLGTIFIPSDSNDISEDYHKSNLDTVRRALESEALSSTITSLHDATALTSSFSAGAVSPVYAAAS